MRRLAFLALGFSGAMLALTGVLWAYAGYFCVAAGAAFALTALLSLRFQKLRIPAVILLGAVLAGAWLLVLQRCYYAPFYELDDRTVSGEVCIRRFWMQIVPTIPFRYLRKKERWISCRLPRMERRWIVSMRKRNFRKRTNTHIFSGEIMVRYISIMEMVREIC